MGSTVEVMKIPPTHAIIYSLNEHIRLDEAIRLQHKVVA